MLQGWSKDPEKSLCAHNGKEFDYPYICRRMIINSIAIPEALKIAYGSAFHNQVVSSAVRSGVGGLVSAALLMLVPTGE